VLVATSPVPAGVSAEALASVTETQDVPKAYLVDSPVSSLNDEAGQFLTTGLAEGSQISTLFFGDQPIVSAAAVQPHKGRVALAIQVGITPGVAKYVSPGSTVDMFVTYGGAGATSSSTTTSQLAGLSVGGQTKLFASGVKVLSVTPATADTSADTEAAASTSTVSPGDNVIAIVEVDPGLAQKIVNATTLGDIYLALTAKNDTHKTSRGATPSDVVKSNR
jgi:Flp pilus assembly protein CpaB